MSTWTHRSIIAVIRQRSRFTFGPPLARGTTIKFNFIEGYGCHEPNRA